ncbi:hypothetical protein ACJRO7_012230 [Eucalyptus globulus]|uniref:Uncharacterized protein n=1 Tax=Eucalyptus globulus TaxID=34317 RepID=A0ABD3LL78_EUCGL
MRTGSGKRGYALAEGVGPSVLGGGGGGVFHKSGSRDAGGGTGDAIEMLMAWYSHFTRSARLFARGFARLHRRPRERARERGASNGQYTRGRRIGSLIDSAKLARKSPHVEPRDDKHDACRFGSVAKQFRL